MILTSVFPVSHLIFTLSQSFFRFVSVMPCPGGSTTSTRVKGNKLGTDANISAISHAEGSLGATGEFLRQKDRMSYR